MILEQVGETIQDRKGEGMEEHDGSKNAVGSKKSESLNDKEKVRMMQARP